MNPTSAVILSSVIVWLGRWAQNKSVSQKIIVGTAFSVIGLSIMAEYDDKLARQFGALMLVTSVLIYGVPVTKKLGLIK